MPEWRMTLVPVKTVLIRCHDRFIKTFPLQLQCRHFTKWIFFAQYSGDYFHWDRKYPFEVTSVCLPPQARNQAILDIVFQVHFKQWFCHYCDSNNNTPLSYKPLCFCRSLQKKSEIVCPLSMDLTQLGWTHYWMTLANEDNKHEYLTLTAKILVL